MPPPNRPGRPGTPGAPDGLGAPPSSPEEQKFRLLQVRQQLRSAILSDEDFEELQAARRAADEAARTRAQENLASVEEQLAALENPPASE